MLNASKNKKGLTDMNGSLDSIDSISEDKSSLSSIGRAENSEDDEKTREENKSQSDQGSAKHDPKSPRSPNDERRGSYYTDDDTVSSSSGSWNKDGDQTLESPRKDPGEGEPQNGSLLKEIENEGTISSSHDSEDSLKRYQEILQQQYVQEIAAKEGTNKETRKGTGRKKNYKSPYEKRGSETATSRKQHNYVPKSKQQEVPDYILKELDSITGTGELIQRKKEVSDGESDASRLELQEHVKRRVSNSPIRRSKRKKRGRSRETGLSISPDQRQGVQSRQKSRLGFDYSARPVRLMVFRNGDRETCAFIAVCNFEDMLSTATAKLHLLSAARKVFLKGGHMVKSWKEITSLSNASDENGEYLELYISSGEPYRNPYKCINDSARLKKSLIWTLNGIQLPEDEKRGKTAVKVPERLKEMSGTSNKRLLIFRNGNGRDGCEVVIGPNDFQHFLETSSMSLQFGAPAQKVFDLTGKEVTTLSEVGLLPKLWSHNKRGGGLVYGPLWVSKGDGFSGLGPRDFIQNILSGLNERKKYSEFVIEQIELASDEPKKVTMKEFLSMGEEELYDHLTDEQSKLEAVKEQIQKLKSTLSELQPRIDEETKEGSRLRMSHIKEFSHDDGVHSKLLGKPALRVIVHENGVDGEGNVIFYNMDLAAKISKGYQNDLGPFLDHCVASCYKLANPRFSPFACKPKLLFDAEGREVESLKNLKEDNHYWLSFGEPFMPPFTRVVQLRENENDPSDVGLTIDRKMELKNVSSSTQMWSFKKSGQICPVRRPKFCLTVKSDTISSPFRTDDGASLMVVTVEENDKRDGQFFEFTSEGTIQSLSYVGLFLTYVQTNTEDGIANPELVDSISFNGLLLREKFPAQSKLASCQRFGLKQEGSRCINEYRKSQIPNMEWGKRALSWPTDTDGNLIHDFKWPMIGFLVCDAPSTKSTKSKSSSKIPLRLQVLINGCCDKNSAVKVLAPDVSQLFKKLKHSARSSAAEDQAEGAEDKLHCLDLTIRQHEFIGFLQNCTSLLQLSFAARRLFDESGVELFSLENLQRFSVVYVSSGEPWIDPGTFNGTDLHYAARLASDVRAIEHFVTLRECQGLCLEVEGEVLKEGALVRVGKCGLTDMDRAELARTPTPPPPPPKIETEEEMLAKKTPHFRSHYHSNKYFQPSGWMAHCKECKDSKRCILHPHEIPKPPPPVIVEHPQNYAPNYYKQSFIFENGFIICKFDKKLALSINQFGRAILAKLDVTDSAQQWHVNSQGNLYPGSKVDHVLTVSMPIVMPGQEMCDAVTELYCGSEVQLQPACKHKFGSAHQKWSLDPKLGIIDAFATSQLDCDITIANRSGVCTNALNNGVALDQIGYTMMHHNTKCYLCVSCARVIRGSGKSMEKIGDPIRFSCDIQSGSPISKIYRGSFKALTKKLNLSTSESSDTLAQLREKLNRIQNQKVAIADKPFSFYEPALLISVLAWKNGEPKSEQEPALVTGSSIEQILSAANSKLGFAASGATAEYIFTPSGDLITTTEQLIHWSFSKYSESQTGKQTGGSTFRKTNRENTFSRIEDDVISHDSPSTDITLRPGTAPQGKRDGSHNDTFDNVKESSPSVESPLTRPGAPEPVVNLFKNANFRERIEDDEDVPSSWNAVNGAQLICNFDDDLETTVCRVERPKPTSAISQDLSDVLSLNCRYKLNIKVFLEDLENQVFKCTVVFKRTRKSRAEVLPVIIAEVNRSNWVEMRGAVNMPRSAESDLFQCYMLFALDSGDGSFSVAELELKDDVSEVKSPDTNLFENSELNVKNGLSQPAYWLPGNPSSKLTVKKPGTCDVTPISRQSETSSVSDADDVSEKEKTLGSFSCFYDITHIISKENLYKLEVDFRAITAPGAEVFTLLSYKVSGHKEKTINLSKNEIHENSWHKVSSSISLPHASSDEIIEYCAIRFECKNSFVFRMPALFCCTAAKPSKSPPKSLDGLISDEEDVPLDENGQISQTNNKNFDMGETELDRTELNKIFMNYPLEVFVSSTNKFMDPKAVMEKFHQEKEMFNRRRLTGVHMDIEKHKLRLLKGRRIGKCTSARLEPTEDPTQPVVVTGSWMDVSKEEIRLGRKVQKLKKTYDIQNSREPSKLTNGDYAKPLRPQGKPVSVYKNGEDPSLATNIVSVWANSYDDILATATERLRMGFAARKLYRCNGEMVTNFDEIEKHELLCASLGENFVNHEDAKRRCFLKSRWARDKRLGRERPPDIVIKPRINPYAKVDPLRDAWYSKTAKQREASSKEESRLVQSSVTFLTQLPVS